MVATDFHALGKAVQSLKPRRRFRITSWDITQEVDAIYATSPWELEVIRFRNITDIAIRIHMPMCRLLQLIARITPISSSQVKHFYNLYAEFVLLASSPVIYL